MKMKKSSSPKTSSKAKKTPEGDLSLRDQRNMLCDKLDFAGSEAYKLLRNNILFSLPDQNKCRVIGVTSSIRGEGKSTTAINLSYTLAETGKRVLLIDADMRLPSVAKKLASATRPGLSNLLVGMNSPKECLHESGLLDTWYLMPAGDLPPNPSELLGSDAMEKALGELSREFDIIIFDLPPVTIVSDALTVSRLLDGMILAVRQDHTSRSALNECMRQMNFLNTKLLGFVLTGASAPSKGYGKYGKYGKYGHDYGYGYGAAKTDGSKTDAAAPHKSTTVRESTAAPRTAAHSDSVMDTIAKTVDGSASERTHSSAGRHVQK